MTKPNNLEREISRLEEVLVDLDPTEKEYHKILYMIDKLQDARDKNKKFSFKVSGDTIVAASVNLLGIVLVLQHERLHAVSSKALGFITKLKV